MAHDKNRITISRFGGFDTAEGRVAPSVTWHAAVTPEHRKWILYEDTTGVPYLYIRGADTETAAGDAVEHYVYAGDASGLTRAVDPIAPAVAPGPYEMAEAYGYTGAMADEFAQGVRVERERVPTIRCGDPRRNAIAVDRVDPDRPDVEVRRGGRALALTSDGPAATGADARAALRAMLDVPEAMDAILLSDDSARPETA